MSGKVSRPRAWPEGLAASAVAREGPARKRSVLPASKEERTTPATWQGKRAEGRPEPETDRVVRQVVPPEPAVEASSGPGADSPGDLASFCWRFCSSFCSCFFFFASSRWRFSNE